MALDSDLRGDEKKHRFWNTAPVDPVKAARQDGRPHYNRVLGRVLMPDSFMPLGEHREKTMRNVPPAYFKWLLSQPWFVTSAKWASVRDYLERFPVEPDKGDVAKGGGS